jgi:uncharacterized protein (TIGR03435 family)
MNDPTTSQTIGGRKAAALKRVNQLYQAWLRFALYTDENDGAFKILRVVPLAVAVFVGTSGRVVELGAQAQTPKAPAFEVASVRRQAPSQSPSGGRTFKAPSSKLVGISGNRYDEGYLTLTDLIMRAYDVFPFQVTGVPPWGGQGGDDYAVDAIAPGNPTPGIDEFRLMLQALLADRFHMKVHRENKEFSVYDLVVAKGGPKIREARAEDTTKPTTSAQVAVPRLKGSMEFLRLMISSVVDRPVLDKTGLTAKVYEFQWNQAELINEKAQGGGLIAPSAFTAVQSLGLRLETQKAPMEVIVIDRAERPSEN